MKHRQIRLLAHNVRSLWNVGSFFRTADAMNVEKIYLTGYTGHPPRKEITKTALGAEETVDWEKAPEPLPLLKSLQEDGWELVALELTSKSRNIHLFKPSDKVCLIVGHELTGVPEDVLAICDSIVQIPMLGKKESLNVAVAAGIALYSLRIQP
ncbi:MAG TPA: RNA methyltransferase [Candidatus Peribacteraceae bacterium]|nr:RNA methyltransferase [Candidatus Peribacteraceae bacterium]